MIENPYIPFPVRVEAVTVENEARDIRTFRLKFERPDDRLKFDFRVGQFAELSLLGFGEAPVGIASSPLDGEHLEFTVKRYPSGVVTTALHDLQAGAALGMRGPMGNGYPIERLRGKNVVIISGGFAVTTLRALIRYLLHPSVRSSVGEITVIYGARSPGELCYKREFLEWSERQDIDVHLTVDKGDGSWAGRVGFVPAVVAAVQPSSENALCFICGPPIMLKFTMPELTKLNFAPEDTFLSFEMRMKCGIGKCGRCNIGSSYVCVDGPVFSLAQTRAMPSEY